MSTDTPISTPSNTQASMAASSTVSTKTSASTPTESAIADARRSWRSALPWVAVILSLLALLAALISGIQYSGAHKQWTRLTQQNAQLENAYQQEQLRNQNFQSTQRNLEDKVRSQELLLNSYQQRLSSLEQTRGNDKSLGVLLNLAGNLRIAEQHSTLTGKRQPVLAALDKMQSEAALLPEDARVQILAAIQQDRASLESSEMDNYQLSQHVYGLLNIAPQVQWLSSSPTTLANTPSGETKKPSKNSTAATIPSTTNTADAETSPLHTTLTPWWQEQWRTTQDTLRQLVRVSDVEDPTTSMLSSSNLQYVKNEYRLLLSQSRLLIVSQDYAGAERTLGEALTLLAKYADIKQPANTPSATMLKKAQHALKNLQPSSAPETQKTFQRLLENHATEQP